MEEETGKEKGGDKESPNNNSSNPIHKESPAKKAKSCKGCVYYSSTLKSNSRNPLCVGIPRSIPQDVVNKDDVPMFVLGDRIGDEGTSDTAGPECIVGVSEIEASREGFSLADFKYACVGYSIYSDRQGSSVDAQETQAELPICVGLEVLVDRKVNTAVDPVPAGVQNKEDAHGFQPPWTHKHTHSAGDEFLSRCQSNEARLAQLVERKALNLVVVGSSPTVKKLEAQGVPSKHAEAITAAINEVLNDNLVNVTHSFVSKAETQKIEMIQESNLSKFKAKVQSSQENHFSQHETVKLRSEIEKMRSELSYEIDKVPAKQRLDLNLERGRMQDESTNQNQQNTNLTNKLDREIHELRAQSEAAKHEVIKYCIGTLVSISTVGLAVVGILNS
ncbi:hypothetical protein RHGRI_030587 [Rhododendron griersonianum]|uniref:DUF8204 domain-containing protein n=1 Tax=Rhododendron griersonianum TaxID=479676 RepID=A0AAV6IS04_9ERIC|nr:hypothetical protein RHGRI_030587 [Rhododendron griersonianum]